jgi:hypothetical protein
MRRSCTHDSSVKCVSIKFSFGGDDSSVKCVSIKFSFGGEHQNVMVDFHFESNRPNSHEVQIELIDFINKLPLLRIY